MDVFHLRDTLIDQYSAYIKSFITIDDARIRAYVDEQLQEGLLYPRPLIQLNPNFEPGSYIKDLVKNGTLHPDCDPIFRRKSADGRNLALRLHRHQEEAIHAANAGDNYVLTTGTGSGKSLAYIIPIVNHVLRRGTGKGIQAIIVYPMNALANSQYGELEKYIQRDMPELHFVTFRQYTGQEKEEERNEIIANPPDILLTNYVMLELMLTRTREKQLIAKAKGLRFLVLDELHTYRGRQGADVALLVRRLREFCESDTLQCVGTSATMGGGDTWADQQQTIATVATRLFGTEVKSERVIGETLRRATATRDINDPAFRAELRTALNDHHPLPEGYDAFSRHPLAIWIESTFGLATERVGGRLRRATPRAIDGAGGAAQALATLTGVSIEQCRTKIRQILLHGYDLTNPDTSQPTFAFRLHQFISRGDTVYASLAKPETRHITTQAQQFVPGSGRDEILLPLAFCRHCGQEYYLVEKAFDRSMSNTVVRPRELSDHARDEESEKGYLYYNPTNLWNPQDEGILERLPERWLEDSKNGPRVRSAHRKKLPQLLPLDLRGQRVAEGQGTPYIFVPSPFAFCLNCGVTYGSRERSDFGKLNQLSAGGRSTATTILTLNALQQLRDDDTLDQRARKLLSFTDNRQDASLQAGHFNDFIEVSLLRAALYKAVQRAGSDGLRHDELPAAVLKALDLKTNHYLIDPNLRFRLLEEANAAMREVLAYRLYFDLRRGWRITTPNLEQVGLLSIQYESLADLCAAEDIWSDKHALLVSATPQQRAHIATVLLDYLRRELAIKVDYLNREYQDRIRQRSNQHLIPPWALDENETMFVAPMVFPRSRGSDSSGGANTEGQVYLSARGGFGQFLRRPKTFPDVTPTPKLTLEDTTRLIRDVLEALRVAGLVEQVYTPRMPQNEQDVPGYQIPAAALRWVAGDGSHLYHDPIRVPRLPDTGTHVNPYFVDFYQHRAAALVGLRAKEHTAQVPNEERQDREREFRKATLPLLFCSPTMELGVDIAELNVVNMRNVPPTPANYAQRSGRAGRSGQPALVFTYCTTGSSHDQYFFKRPAQMVAGVVSTPRLDLANEDLVRSHVYAVWLKEANMSLGHSLRDLLEMEGDPPTLEVKESIGATLQNLAVRRRAEVRVRRIFATMENELARTDWYSLTWLHETLTDVERAFEVACDRWRDLFRAAEQQRIEQNRIANDITRPQKERDQATRLRAEAEAQRNLLIADEKSHLFQSDFYSYRYFASEGFLPGYNFPRLPLSAFIPARRARGLQQNDEFLSRPRFLAISEFGPRSILYHEGSRYVINRVILPVGKDFRTTVAKLCPACGYLHPLEQTVAGYERCERCTALLDHPLNAPLLRLQNVSTQRRDRINCDEEERTRMGYEIKTGVRFTPRGERPAYRVATLTARNGDELFRLTYGHAATLWRINLGWRRRTNPDQQGFVLDMEKGYWAKTSEESESDPDGAGAEGATAKRIIPYVEDRRNCLLIEPLWNLDTPTMASLQPALKNAIQVLYQLEDNELAAEPLPSSSERRIILLYESSEGGAGVLRQLVEDVTPWRDIARTALDLCHFDPDTGNDLHRAPHGQEDCEAACYDCLLSYSNQLDHGLLDRHLAKPILEAFTSATLAVSPGSRSRSDHFAYLHALCESTLEQKWLTWLEQQQYPLPDDAQRLIESCSTRPDFLYRDLMVAIFIDGPVHDYSDIIARDQLVTDCLFDMGYTVIRFRSEDKEWEKIAKEHTYLFKTIL